MLSADAFDFAANDVRAAQSSSSAEILAALDQGRARPISGRFVAVQTPQGGSLGRHEKISRKPESWAGQNDTHQVMDAPPPERRDDSSFQPEAEAGGTYDGGERDCWDEVYASFEIVAPLIRRDARRQRVPASEQDDILQATIGEAWAHRLEPRGGEKPLEWIRRLGRRFIRRWRRRIAEIQYLDPRDLTQVAGSDAPHRQPLAQVEDADERDRIDALLRRAGHGHRALLVARFIEGKRVAEIADELGVTPKAAERRLERAIAVLRKLTAGERGGGSHSR